MWGLDKAAEHIAHKATPDNPPPAIRVGEPWARVVGAVREAQRVSGGPCARFNFSGTPWCDDCGHTH